MLLGGCFAALAAMALAGGGPLNTLVVVNDASPDSLEIGLRYARSRGIPEAHICHVQTATGGTVLVTVWSNEIRNPVLSYIASSGLSNQIDYVVFAHAFPYRVMNDLEGAPPPNTNELHASLTSSMYYDHYASSNAFLFGCQLNALATNAYFARDRAFERPSSPNARYLISAFLTGYTADETRATLRRAAESDFTSPSGRIDLVRTSDGNRSVRWPLHEEADYRARLSGLRNEWVLRTLDPIPPSTNRMGYLTGRAVMLDIFSNKYTKGAYADHLTSFGGRLDNPGGQTLILDWLKAGAAGSYGTVVEPCAYTVKFPDPLIYARYERGFTLGESLYMSVAYPYQGLFVGDPLAAPYAVPPSVTISAPSEGATVSGVATIHISTAASDATRPIHRLDAFVDGLYAKAIDTWSPAAGNELFLALPDATARYEVADGDDVFACATGLAAAVNATSSMASAKAIGDSIQLQWSAFGESASNAPISAWADQGTGSNLHLFVWTPTPNFMESPYAAHEVLVLRGSAVSGDQAVAIITLTNGLVTTNIGFAETNMGALQVFVRLLNAIKTNPALQGSDGVDAVYRPDFNPIYVELVLAARTQGFAGLGIHVDYQILTQPGSTLSTNDAFQDFFNDNASVMRPRALARIAEGATNPASAFAVDTTDYPNGPLRIDVVARDGTAVRTQGRATRWIVVSNSSFRCELAHPPRFHHVLRGGAVTSIAEVADGAGATTQVIFYVEGKYAGAVTAAPYTWVWPTTNAAIGPIHVQAVAYNDAGEAARSWPRPVVIFTDDDSDGLSDQWEIDWFGSITNAAPAGDPDGDGFTNLEEFLAGTDPTDPASYLALTALVEDPVVPAPRISFDAVSTRVYRVQWADDEIDATWFTATGALSGATGSIDWLDVPSNAPPAPGSLRAYRVQTQLP